MRDKISLETNNSTLEFHDQKSLAKKNYLEFYMYMKTTKKTLNRTMNNSCIAQLIPVKLR